MKLNNFLKVPEPENLDPDLKDKMQDNPIRPRFEAYQQKIFYDVYPDSSDVDG